MIPQQLTLKNFLSYQEATLDFRGLHTACICGPNGAGKSSLLEAISWAIWGESRAASEDDVIHQGSKEAQVDFIFTNYQHTYRIIRSRHRGQTTSLEFQIARPDPTPQPDSDRPSTPSFRTLTAKNVRATQQLILEHIKLDYETFINSAYLRQGRADEFMLKRPGDRKQILADMLKLNQYDSLAERAKDQFRQIKGQIDLLQRQLETIQTQLQQREQIAQEQVELETLLETTRQQQIADGEQLQILQARQQKRQTWAQQMTWQQQQQRILEQDCHRLQQELAIAQQQQQEVETLLQQSEAIAIGYAQFQTLQEQEEALASRYQTYQTIQAHRQQYQQQQAEKVATGQRQLQHAQTQLESFLQQETENEQILNQTAEVESGLAHLQQSRMQLTRLDQLQTQATPLLQRRQQLQRQLDRISTRLLARLEELHASTAQLQQQQQRQPHLQQAVVEVSDRIETLEQRRAYQQRVREKGVERRNFMERLQAHQRNCETQIAEVEQKIQLLKQEQAAEGSGRNRGLTELEREFSSSEAALQRLLSESGKTALCAESPVSYPATTTAYPPCPLCNRPLDEQHWQLVLEKHQVEHQELLEQLWVIREQLAASEREIQVLRQEYRELDSELAQYGTVLERRGQLQEQLQMTTEGQIALQQVMTEATEIERSLQTGTYAADLQEELALLDRTLQQLNYDERDHALARGEVDRWRWAEIRQAELKQVQQRQAHINQRVPELETEMDTLHTLLKQLNTETATQLTRFDEQLAQIGYDLEQHNALRTALRQSQSWQLRYQELERAQQSYPQVQLRVQELARALQERQQHLQAAHTQLEALAAQLEQIPDCQVQIQTLDEQLQERRSHLDDQIARLGRLQQQQQHLEALSMQYTTSTAELQKSNRQYRIYQELSQAFGRNGIQTLMIENVLPQLEAETNQILSRLSANQLHVQFVTQRSNRRDQARSAKAKLQNTKLIETLDILIADARGTRPYETYSGGEAFRINFAIRLALARLLAQRSGTALQLLIIDEGFGTQDAEGCGRLVAAINAIAPDFACILAVTHVPHLKESFQVRIEVDKTATGSRLSLLA